MRQFQHENNGIQYTILTNEKEAFPIPRSEKVGYIVSGTKLATVPFKASCIHYVSVANLTIRLPKGTNQEQV